MEEGRKMGRAEKDRRKERRYGSVKKDAKASVT